MRITPSAEQLDYLNSLGVSAAATTTRASSSITVRQPHRPGRAGPASQAGAAKRKWTPAILVACVAGIVVLVVGCLVAWLAIRGFTFSVVRANGAVEERPINGVNRALKVAGPPVKKAEGPQQDRQAVLERVEEINRDLDDMLQRLKQEDLP